MRTMNARTFRSLSWNLSGLTVASGIVDLHFVAFLGLSTACETFSGTLRRLLHLLRGERVHLRLDHQKLEHLEQVCENQQPHVRAVRRPWLLGHQVICNYFSTDEAIFFLPRSLSSSKSSFSSITYAKLSLGSC